jgi:hypothetical protein
MPLTAKGNEIMKAMQKEYGAKKGESVFYASKNKGKISGVEQRRRRLAEAAKRLRNAMFPKR